MAAVFLAEEVVGKVTSSIAKEILGYKVPFTAY